MLACLLRLHYAVFTAAGNVSLNACKNTYQKTNSGVQCSGIIFKEKKRSSFSLWNISSPSAGLVCPPQESRISTKWAFSKWLYYTVQKAFMFLLAAFLTLSQL
jgi:hypothetical protein